MSNTLWANCSCGDRFEGKSADDLAAWITSHRDHQNIQTGERSEPFGSSPIQLRRGERIRLEEFAADSLEPMHDRLDAIAAEDDGEAS